MNNIKLQRRRTNALNRLESQLVLNKKSTKSGTVQLTDHDKKRIKSEIKILKEKLNYTSDKE